MGQPSKSKIKLLILLDDLLIFDNHMIIRNFQLKVEEILKWSPAIAILGPRQVGKTNWLKALRKKSASIYLDLENPQDHLKLEDSFCYLNSL
jgi:hypothetical protein